MPAPPKRKPRRRANGEGGPYQDGDRWRYPYWITLPSGQKVRRTDSGPTKVAVTTKHRQRLADQAAGLTLSPKDTVGAYLERWLLGRPALRTRPSTQQAYRQRVNSILPLVGGLRLAEFGTARAQHLLRELTDAGYAPGTVRAVRTMLKTAFADAVRDNLLARNPLAATDPPKVERATRRLLSEQQALHLLQTAEAAGDDSWPLWWICLCTGLRLGEVLGMRWPDVDVPAGVLHHTVQLKRAHGVWFLDVPKGDSARDLPLVADALRALRVRQAMQAEDRAREGVVWHVDPRLGPLVWTDAAGQALHQQTVGRRLRLALGRAELPTDMHPHELRHSVATLLQARGVDIGIISAILGHSGIAITSKFYTHTDVAVMRAALEKVRLR